MKTLIKRQADQFDTIENMKKYAIIGSKNPFFSRYIARHNLKNNLESIKKISKFIFNHVYFEKDKSNNQIIRYGTRALRDGFGNCVDYSVLLSQFLLNLGVKHSFKMVATEKNDPKSFNHIFVMLDNYNLPIDLVIGQDQQGNESFKNKRTMYLFKQVPYYTQSKLKVL